VTDLGVQGAGSIAEIVREIGESQPGGFKELSAKIQPEIVKLASS
jgi:hypothetical protein